MLNKLQEGLQEETVPEVPEIEKFYIQVNAEGLVLGYSSSKTPNGDEIEVDKDSLSEEFLNLPFFHRYKEDTNEFILDEALRQAKIDEKNNRLSNDQRLGQQVSNLEIQIMMMQQMMQQTPTN